MIDDATALQNSVKIARAYIEGRLTPLQAGRKIIAYVTPFRPCWDALGGVEGLLSAFYIAQDHADRLHFLGDEVERWHPDVREDKRIELVRTEALMAPKVLKACHALIEYAAKKGIH